MPLIEHAHHTSLPVQNLERSCAFYEGVLGLERIERPELGVRGVWYGVNGFEVHLRRWPGFVLAGWRCWRRAHDRDSSGRAIPTVT